jgi:hypothetical protein
LAALIGPDVLALQSMLFFKQPGQEGQGYHQDSYYIPTFPDTLCGAWLALTPATLENGCLWYAVGSQHEPIYPDVGGTGAGINPNLGADVALITDGRFSGGTHGFVVGHITPEAALGGPLALVRNGDRIVIDARARQVTLEVPARELAARRKAWKAPRPRYTRGVLAKYARLVGSASEGAVTDPRV